MTGLNYPNVKGFDTNKHALKPFFVCKQCLFVVALNYFTSLKNKP